MPDLYKNYTGGVNSYTSAFSNIKDKNRVVKDYNFNKNLSAWDKLQMLDYLQKEILGIEGDSMAFRFGKNLGKYIDNIYWLSELDKHNLNDIKTQFISQNPEYAKLVDPKTNIRDYTLQRARILMNNGYGHKALELLKDNPQFITPEVSKEFAKAYNDKKYVKKHLQDFLDYNTEKIKGFYDEGNVEKAQNIAKALEAFYGDDYNALAQSLGITNTPVLNPQDNVVTPPPTTPPPTNTVNTGGGSSVNTGGGNPNKANTGKGVTTTQTQTTGNPSANTTTTTPVENNIPKIQDHWFNYGRDIPEFAGYFDKGTPYFDKDTFNKLRSLKQNVTDISNSIHEPLGKSTYEDKLARDAKLLEVENELKKYFGDSLLTARYEKEKPISEILNIKNPNPNIKVPERLITPTIPNTSSSGTWNNIKTGLGNFAKNTVAKLPDMLSLYGQYKASNDALNTLIESKSGDTPNINPFANYGQKALSELDKSFQNLGYTRDANIANLNSNLALNNAQIRNNTISTATANALAQNSFAQGIKSYNDIQNNHLNNLNNYYSNRANMLNNIDNVVMQGEAQRDLADRQDRDAFYSNLSQAYANQSAGYQQLAKSFNEMRLNDVQTKLVNSLSRYGFEIDPYTGDLRKKEK